MWVLSVPVADAVLVVPRGRGRLYRGRRSEWHEPTLELQGVVVRRREEA